MSRHNRFSPPPKAIEPKAADVSSEPENASAQADDVPTVAIENAPSKRPSVPRFKVGHGSVQHDSGTYLTGEALPFTAEQIVLLGLTHLAVPIED